IFADVGSKLGISCTDTVEGAEDIGGSSFSSGGVDLVGEDDVFSLDGVHNSFTGNWEGRV
ncbi:hypothetical protein PanWU01x14_164690, partial [Parasponia andersonii]